MIGVLMISLVVVFEVTEDGFCATATAAAETDDKRA